MVFQIRQAAENDIPQMLAMIREFAEFENLLDYCEVTEERLQVALFSEKAIAEAIVATENKTPVAYAIFFPFFSSFRGQSGLYLEDIYIKPEVRGKSLGEKMLRFIAKLGKLRGFERIDFQVLNWNKSAINFYIKLGAVVDETERHFKFTDDAFQRLAF
jgi:ribosomal protein S18 acetylase RimI-like enzyme